MYIKIRNYSRPDSLFVCYVTVLPQITFFMPGNASPENLQFNTQPL